MRCFCVKLACPDVACLPGHAQERDTVSAAVHAAGALLYPLRWQHIYLPLLPLALKVRAGRPNAHATHVPGLADISSSCIGPASAQNQAPCGETDFAAWCLVVEEAVVCLAWDL